MKSNEKIIVDELKICYLAKKEILGSFENVIVGGAMHYYNHMFHRYSNERFHYYFVIKDEYGELAQLYYGLYTESNTSDRQLVYYKIANPVLYQKDRKQKALELPKMMGFIFNNYSAIDLAFDSTKNLPSLIRKMFHNKEVTTIFNGKVVKDRKTVMKGAVVDYSLSLNKLLYPSLTFKQKKAVKNKSEGITVQAYDKKAEILNCSGKQYILDYYGNPRRLYRLEVRLRYRELKEYFDRLKIVPSTDLLLDVGLLKDLFIFHLSTVIRFRENRKIILWTDLLEMSSGGVYNNNPHQYTNNKDKTKDILE